MADEEMIQKGRLSYVNCWRDGLKDNAPATLMDLYVKGYMNGWQAHIDHEYQLELVVCPNCKGKIDKDKFKGAYMSECPYCHSTVRLFY